MFNMIIKMFLPIERKKLLSLTIPSYENNIGSINLWIANLSLCRVTCAILPDFCFENGWISGFGGFGIGLTRQFTGHGYTKMI